MADAPDRDQQTEEPTPKRRQDASNEGDVLMSRELASALVMLVAVGWLALAGSWLVKSSMQMLREGLAVDRAQLSAFDAAHGSWLLIQPILLPLGVLFAVTLAAAIIGPAFLGSFGWRSKSMAFKGNRISPLAGIKRMFGLQGLTELLKALAKAAILGGIGWWFLDRELAGLLGLAETDVSAAANQLGGSLINLLFALVAGMAAIALVDIPAQMFQRTRRLRMTREQLKEELRQAEGSPELKAHLRARQQAILSQSARKAMVDANVVLNNPAHFSVALRYRPGLDAAPLVVARGRDEVALAMRALAADNDVPALDYPQLTRAIYFSTRAGQPIPEDLYQAVAIILAFVFRLDRELGARTPPPPVEVPQARRMDAEGRPED